MAARRQTNASAATSSAALIRSIRHIMRPIVRLMMRHGIVLQTFHQLIKSVYTEESEKEIKALGGTATDLQISMMTGLHRKEVKRFREEGYDAFILSPTLSMGADVVTRWLTDKRFQSARREPRALSIRKGKAVETFSTLVKSVDAELRPSVVLAEMVRMGIVHVENEMVHLVVDAFVPQKAFDDQVQYLAENGHDHLAAVVHNLSAAETQMLEQSISATALSAASAEELERTARSLWKQVMQQLMERAIELEGRDKIDEKHDARINFGAYFYKESVPTLDGSPTTGKRAAKRTGAIRS